MGLAFLASACDGSAQAPASPAEATNADAENAAAAQTQAQRACMIDALNNTIAKKQSDVAVISALAAQDLSGCPNDFIESFVRMRNAAEDYMAVSRELFAHQGYERDANDRDWLNLGCSIIAGKQCMEWPSEIWASANAEIKARFETAKASLKSAKRDNEEVVARYGIYARANSVPEQRGIDGDPNTVSNTIDNGAWDHSL
ncbi:hypothetical protein RLDS_05825 [Sphingobium lactosutens DS20]|uniref:Uncharacterized protein n=2 Tax=Sphingobium TaxID=165695 RepID=T0HXZ4_9SPHN|nr:hypothetical protein RLDS_05825 [Sphingobium lactosutens DS20]